MDLDGVGKSTEGMEKRERVPLSGARIPLAEYRYEVVSSRNDGVTRFRSADDFVFEVRDAAARISSVMAEYVEEKGRRGFGDDALFDLANVPEDTLEKVLEYCYFHASTTRASMNADEVLDWDMDFVDLQPQELCELASAAYYLDIKSLVDLTCKQIASLISGKSAEEIRTTFNIENDIEDDYRLPPEWYSSGCIRGNRHRTRLLTFGRHMRKMSRRGREKGSLVRKGDYSNADDRPLEDLLRFIDGTGPLPDKAKKKKGRKKNKCSGEEQAGASKRDQQPSQLPSSSNLPTETNKEPQANEHEEVVKPAVRATANGHSPKENSVAKGSLGHLNTDSTSEQQDNNTTSQDNQAKSNSSTSKASRKRARKRARKREKKNALKNAQTPPASVDEILNGIPPELAGSFMPCEAGSSHYSDEEALDVIDLEVAAFAHRLQLYENVPNGVQVEELAEKRKNIRLLEEKVEEMDRKARLLEKKIEGLGREKAAALHSRKAAEMELERLRKEMK